MRKRVAAVLFLASTVAGCGGGDSSVPSSPSASPSRAPAPVELTPQEKAAQAVSSLLGLPDWHLAATRATLDSTFYGRPAGLCGISGTQQMTLDGTHWAAQAKLPAGKHTLTARFDGCTFSGPMEDIILNGSVEMVYEGSGPEENVAVVLTTNAFSYFGVVVHGPSAYSIENAQDDYRVSNELRAGAVLTNQANTKRIDFKGGRYQYSSIHSTNPNTDTEEYLAVVMDFNGVRYVLDGRIVLSYTYTDSMSWRCAGEVRITDANGGLVGRKHCPSSGIAEYELLKAVPSFW